MPRPSAFDVHFSAAEQAKIAAWLDEHPATSVDDFREWLEARGLKVGRSTAGKEQKRLKDLGKKLRGSRRVMEALAEGMEGQDDSRQGRALLEMARTLVFKFQEGAVDQNAELETREIYELSRALKELMMAGRYNQDYAANEREARARMRAAADAKLAAAEGEVGTASDPKAVLRRVRREVYGILDD